MEKLGKEFKDVLSSITQIGEDDIELVKMLSKNDKTKIVLTALGNSISTGFSFCDENKPLLDRNELLDVICEEYGIDLYKYKFARSENNSDQNTLNYILNNDTEHDINELNRRDYEKYLLNGNSLLTKEQIEKYYGDKEDSDVHIQDILFNTEDDAANIVVYNGCTGSFLDNITRGGKHKYDNGIKKDLSHVEAILSLIQNSNRENESNTQVYLCGAPRVLNTGIQDYYMNRPLKTISKRYANTTYVDNFKRHFVYKGNAKVDLHYDKNEYLKLTHLILKRIIENYIIKDSLIGIDRDLYHLNKEIEMSNEERNTKDAILSIISDYSFYLEDDKDTEFLKTVRDYLLERYCYDFFCLDKSAIKNDIVKLSKNIVL